MLIKLVKDARITHKAGDVVDVPANVFAFLVSVGSGEPIAADGEPEKKPKAKTKAKAKA